MLVIPNTQTVANEATAGFVPFPPDTGALTPYSIGYLFVANASAQIAIKRGPSAGESQWSPYALISPSMVPIGTDRPGKHRPDYIFGVKFVDGTPGVHAQVFGALFQAGEANFIPGTQFIGQVSGTGTFTPVSTPSGVIVAFGGTVAPSGWFVCDGTAVSRTTFSNLFTAIGTLWGAGDGSTTFNLPDLQGRMAVGKGTKAEVNNVGLNEGVALANRGPKHNMTNSTSITGAPGVGSLALPNHGHSISDPSHVHFGYNAPGGDNLGGGWGAAEDSGGTTAAQHSVPNTTGITVGNPTSNPAITGAPSAGSLGVGGTIGPAGTNPIDSPAFGVVTYIIAQ